MSCFNWKTSVRGLNILAITILVLAQQPLLVSPSVSAQSSSSGEDTRFLLPLVQGGGQAQATMASSTPLAIDDAASMDTTEQTEPTPLIAAEDVAASENNSYSVFLPAVQSSDQVAFAAATVVPTMTPLPQQIVYPLRPSADGRHLVDQNNTPFLMVGDSPWSLIVGPTKSEADQYLTTRQQQGFNTMLVNLIEHQFNGPTNAEGQDPFTTPGDFATPNELYFAHADWVLQKALEKGILVLLTPAYLGYFGGSEGWYQEVIANGPTKMKNWGRYVGNRYKNYPNIIWVMGGDYGPHDALDEIRAMVQGIEEVAGSQVFTVHNSRFESGVTQYPVGEAWIDVNTTYGECTQPPYLLKSDYTRTPTLPFFFIEGTYENEGASSVCLRSQAYWPVLMGGTGFLFGNNPIWLFDPGWQTALNSAGAGDMTQARNLFLSRRWQDLVPDFAHTVLTAGFGTLTDATYAPAARTANGNTIIVYTPTQRALTLNMTALSGSQANAWWFNVDTGSAQLIGSYATSGSQTFTPPASGDWLLVVDDAALNAPAPGTLTRTP